LQAAAREFDWHTDTLKKKLIQAKENPGADGTWSTKQMVAAIFGDIAAERLRKVKEEADNVALKNSILRGESLPKGLMTPALEAIFIVIKQLIQASGMSSLEKRDILQTIATWPVAVKTVAQKASRQIKLEKEEANGANGETEED
jgi:hypothetical protein